MTQIAMGITARKKVMHKKNKKYCEMMCANATNDVLFGIFSATTPITRRSEQPRSKGRARRRWWCPGCWRRRSSRAPTYPELFWSAITRTPTSLCGTRSRKLTAQYRVNGEKIMSDRDKKPSQRKTMQLDSTYQP